MSDNNNNNNGENDKVNWGDTEADDAAPPEKMLSAVELAQIGEVDKATEYLYKGEVEINRDGQSSGYITVDSKPFSELITDPAILQATQKMGYNLTSTIQTISIPEIMKSPYKHFLGQSKSGTGKTAAFSIPMLLRVNKQLQQPQGICICPTRELAIQNFEIVKQLSEFSGISVGLLIPEIDPSVSNIPKGKITNQVIICTPGIAFGQISKNFLDLRKISMFVLDEADEMLNQDTLQKQTIQIHKTVNKNVQNVCFSATFNQGVLSFIDKFFSGSSNNGRVMVTLKKDDVVVKSIYQAKVHIPRLKYLNVPSLGRFQLNTAQIASYNQQHRQILSQPPYRNATERKTIQENFTEANHEQMKAELEQIRKQIGLQEEEDWARVNPDDFRHIRGVNEYLRLYVNHKEFLYAAYPDTKFHWNYKYVFLTKFYEILSIGQTIAFANERATAKDIAEVMLRDETNVGVLTREEVNNQASRDRTLSGFRQNKFQMLIATNVLARGINIPTVTAVINFDIPVKGKVQRGATFAPPDYESYIHRIGRTGRWGQTGVALNLIEEEDTLSTKVLYEIACEYDIQLSQITVNRDQDGEIRQVFVDNLPRSVNPESLRAHFAPYGQIEKVELCDLTMDQQLPKIVGSVTFVSSQSAVAAINATNQKPFPGNSQGEVISVVKDEFDFTLHQLKSKILLQRSEFQQKA